MFQRFARLAMVASAVLACTVFPAGATTVPPAMPLAIGTSWDYVGSVPGVTQHTAITATRVLFGRTVWVQTYFDGTTPVLENWWLPGPDGQLAMAGYATLVPLFGIAYDPPLAYIAGDAALGVSWSTASIAYDFPALTPRYTVQNTSSVVEDVMLATPAGSFRAFGLAQDQQTGPVGGATAPTTAAPSAQAWFSPGVGVVQYVGFAQDMFMQFQLSGTGNATAARTSTWGGLKALYR